MWWALHSILWIYRSSKAAVAKRRGRGEKDTMQAPFSAGVNCCAFPLCIHSAGQWSGIRLFGGHALNSTTERVDVTHSL